MAVWHKIVAAHGRVTTLLRLDTKPWTNWLVIYTVLLGYFLVYRCVALTAMLQLFGTQSERSSGNRVAAVFLGMGEDFLLITILLVVLSLVDNYLGPQSTTTYVWLRRSARLLLHALFIILTILSFAADMLLIRSRGLRFTFEFITTYVREFKFTSGFEVSEREIQIAHETVQVSVTVSVLLIAISMLWLDLSKWHLAMLFDRHTQSSATLTKYDLDIEAGGARLSSSDGCTASPTSPPHEPISDYQIPIDPQEKTTHNSKKAKWMRRGVVTAIPLAILTSLTVVLMVITHAVPAVVSATALNDSLNELFRLTLDLQFLHTLGDGTIESAALYLDGNSETYELFQDDVLYRKTTGFKGAKAFDVSVNDSNPPNVLILTVESFRYQDSLYILGNRSQALLDKQHNLTLTPQFDRWAKRGVAFRNFWSSWQTSRSVEGILFGQVPYDHVSDSGTTTGRAKVELNGMPQLFHGKGYETAFSTGARLDYDGWNKFFVTHGFDSVQGAADMKPYAEEHYNISKNDWKPQHEGGLGRGMYWGVQDDVSFQVLGDLLINKTTEQQARVAQGDKKKPLFINHYTISSHTPWEEHPSWYENMTLPDFSPLYKDLRKHRGDVENYAKSRYFTDMELGKFLDRMKKNGILKDTIVVILGDHGQAPESSMTRVYKDEIATTRVAAALIAEGRLAKYAGLILDDAAHQHDVLNTIADIVGVPDGGFLQSGVGRSLKRESVFGERTVWSNNPMHTMAVIRGHQRLSYNRVFSMVGLYDAENDPMETNDLLPSVSDEERAKWDKLREDGRRLSRYFRIRWDNKCISKVKC